MGFQEKILKLTRQLYPKGRAFLMPKDEYLEQLHNGLAVSEAQFYEDSLSTLDHILADNANFTADDATIWESRLGLITNTSLSLSIRKAAILRKYNHPGTIPARQNWEFLQNQLQAAGFDLYVHPNATPQTLAAVLGISAGVGQMGQNQLDDAQLGSVYAIYSSFYEQVQLNDLQMGFGGFQLNQPLGFNQTVANYIDYQKDVHFVLGGTVKNCFFIGGSTFGSFANVDSTRREELRQLILRIKPVESVAYLLVNYI